jgi:hypothetical protein
MLPAMSLSLPTEIESDCHWGDFKKIVYPRARV